MSQPAQPRRPSALEVERRRRRALARRRSAAVATLSTVVALGGLVALVVSSPGWPNVRETFFSPTHAQAALPEILHGFWLNIEMFCIAEVLILLLGLAVAVVRVSTAPTLLPLRLLATGYTDVMRGIPTLLLVFLVGFGLPALQLQGIPSDRFVLGVIALTLSYGAYVAEVFRAGIESVHPSQQSAARSLGLTRGQTLRSIVLPQAVRRVAPPLLNDFVSLQKDTALVSALGVGEAVRAANVYSADNFNYTPLVVTAVLFVVLTIPLARVTDWLGRRALARQQSGAVA